MMSKLMAPLEGLVTKSASYLKPVADTASKYMPGALNSADKVAGVVATGADMLPVYRYLVSRVVIEESLRQAMAEIGNENPAQIAAAPAKPPKPGPNVRSGLKPGPTSPPPKKKGFLGKLVMAAVVMVCLASMGVGAMLFLGGAAIVDGGSSPPAKESPAKEAPAKETPSRDKSTRDDDSSKDSKGRGGRGGGKRKGR